MSGPFLFGGKMGSTETKLMHTKVRPATPEDMPEIRRCHGEIEALMGEELDLFEVVAYACGDDRSQD